MFLSVVFEGTTFFYTGIWDVFDNAKAFPSRILIVKLQGKGKKNNCILHVSCYDDISKWGYFLNVPNLTKKTVFSVSMLSVKVKIVDERTKKENKELMSV